MPFNSLSLTDERERKDKHDGAALPDDKGPNEGDLPPKPKGMRWATYERWVAKYDAAEEMLDPQLVMAASRLMKRL
jgi:hypothetical protein